MKKFAFIALLSISVGAIASTSGNSQNSAIATYTTSVADTTPMHHSTMHKKMVHKKTTMKKPMKDSTKM